MYVPFVCVCVCVCVILLLNVVYVRTVYRFCVFFFLQWNDFSYEELDFFSTVLLRMMKKDMEQKVKEHDYYRISLVQEYENRQELEFNDSDSEILREMTETFVWCCF